MDLCDSLPQINLGVQGEIQGGLHKVTIRINLKIDLFRKESPSLVTAMAGSDLVQSGRPILDDFFQHLWPYIGKNTANVAFQMVKRSWLICIDQ
ncbi:hypothetical protein TNCV_4913261 [Trichonephila clavipes]|nr:hypothetical protein TNCV_4913261 [Trichonephila clavipes]